MGVRILLATQAVSNDMAFVGESIVETALAAVD
jgi:hypothetical protein